MSKIEYRTSDIVTCAMADYFAAHKEEIFAQGMVPMARIALYLAIQSNPQLMTNDGGRGMFESTPDQIGGIGKYSIECGFGEIFDTVETGNRTIIMGAIEVDRFGQANLSMKKYNSNQPMEEAHKKPKKQSVGDRGLPGNTTNHRNAYLLPSHNRDLLVNEVDRVSGAGYNPSRVPKGWNLDDLIDIGGIFTPYGVFDFETPDRSIRLKSINKGISIREIRDNTGFYFSEDNVKLSRLPTPQELQYLEKVDPKGLRHSGINPEQNQTFTLE